MRMLIALLVAAVIGFAAGYVMVSRQLQARHATDLARQQDAWQTEKEQLQTDLEQARQQVKPIAFSDAPARPATAPTSSAMTTATNSTSPQTILARLQALKFERGPGGALAQREMVRLLDDLVRCGPTAVPAIRDFLANGTNVMADLGKGKGPAWMRDVLPSSLRTGLFNALRDIGGPEAEQLLADTAGSTARSDEMLTLARLLEQIAPGKYRDSVLMAARAQLSEPTSAGQPPKDTGQLYEVLAMYGDKTFVDQAKARLLQADGRLNMDALDYLQTSLQRENLPLLKELLQNPQITDPKQKEDVMRFITELAGTDQAANQLWYDSALNAGLPDKAREKAINELDKRGFQNRDQPTEYDRQLAAARLQLLDALQPILQDPNQMSALDKMRAKLAGIVDPSLTQNMPGQPKPPKGAKAK